MTGRRLSRFVSLSMLLTAIVLIAAASPTPTLTGKVVKIGDGDTLTMLVGKTQVMVRLEGIDTPERAQPFGRKAGPGGIANTRRITRSWPRRKQRLGRPSGACGPKPIPPWEWRQKQREREKQARPDVDTGY